MVEDSADEAMETVPKKRAVGIFNSEIREAETKLEELPESSKALTDLSNTFTAAVDFHRRGETVADTSEGASRFPY